MSVDVAKNMSYQTVEWQSSNRKRRTRDREKIECHPGERRAALGLGMELPVLDRVVNRRKGRSLQVRLEGVLVVCVGPARD